MKKTISFLMLVCMMLSTQVSFAGTYTGKLYKVGSMVTTLETGKQYFLFSNATNKPRYAQENASGEVKLIEDPTGMGVPTNLGLMFILETSATEGKYYIKTGNDTYVNRITSSVVSTGTATYNWTIEEIANNPGHYTIKGTLNSWNADAANSSVKGGSVRAANSIGDWSFYTVEMTDLSDLKGEALYNYQMNEDRFVRLYNKRKSTQYLTCDASGNVSGATKNATSFSQIWYRVKTGDGYTLMNAESGKYLSDSYASAGGSATTLYMQYSGNNTDKNTQSWCTISSESDFSGETCLNLGTDGTKVTKWKWSGDSGSDWAMEIVDDVTVDIVRTNLNAVRGWVDEVTDGYYRIVSMSYGTDVTESGQELFSKTRNPQNYAQYWQFKKNGTGYTIQNVFTQNYVKHQTATSSSFLTAKATDATADKFYPKYEGGEWFNTFVITNNASDGSGMHTANTQGSRVVLWSTSANASKWALEKVSLDPAAIDSVRQTFIEYEDLTQNKTTYQTTLARIFTNKACTEINESVAQMSDAELSTIEGYDALPERLKEMVLKVKNNTWQTYKNDSYEAGYEKFFRVADYKIYSNYEKMAWREYTGQSNAYGKLSNPTGIVVNSGDILTIFVDAAPKSGCTLQAELVATDGVPGGHPTGSCTSLKQGMNVIMASEQMEVFIFYQLDDPEKYLKNYPDIKIHIEGGALNGYWDATRDMTNNDWKLLKTKLLKESPHLSLKTNKLVFRLHRDALVQAAGDDIWTITDIWNTMCETEEAYQGLEPFEGRFNNIWNVFSVDYNYMFASTYGTYYHYNTFGSIFNKTYMTHMDGGQEGLWGPSHEMGHNHQSTICIVGTMESSNNLFSNINRFEQGISCGDGTDLSTAFNEVLIDKKAFNELGIYCTTRMFFQLYLYYHAMHNDDTFYPRLFQALRNDPMKKGTQTSGKESYLHFAKKCCDVAQADLSEFFKTYGFFVPISNLYVGDYGDYNITTTQAEIDEALEYMHKYPTKLGNIMFIDERAAREKADANNRFHAVPASDGYKCHGPSQDGLKGGFYKDYTGDPDYKTNGDYFTIKNGTISFVGTGWMGHKFYDRETDELIWATAEKSTSLPSELVTLTPKKYYVVAAEQNGKDVPCAYRENVINKEYPITVNFPDETTKTWNLESDGSDLNKYLPENAIAVYTGTKTIPEAIQTATNLVGKDGTAENIVMNGNQPMCIPSDINAKKASFEREGADEFMALNIPMTVSGTNLYKAEISDNVVNVTKTDDAIEAGAPVIVAGDVNFSGENVVIKAGNYVTKENSYVMRNGCKTIITANAVPFEYIYDQAYTVNFPDDIQSLENTSSNNGLTRAYNLAGQMTNVNAKGLVIVNGKKVFNK